MSLFTFFLFFLSHLASAQLTCGLRTANPFPGRELISRTCEESVRDANCEEYWSENEVPLEMRRNCAEGAVNMDSSEWIARCRDGFFRSWSDYGRALAGGAESLWKALFGPEGDQQKALRLCDEDSTLECKRAFALEAGVKNPQDATLRSRDAAYWQGMARRHQRARNYREALREQSDFIALPPEEKLRLLEQKQCEQSQMRASKGFIERVLENNGVMLACYNERKNADLLCYGVGLILDPTLVAGGGLASLKAAAGLRRATFAFKEVQAASISKLGYTPIPKYTRPTPSTVRIEITHPEFKTNLGFVEGEVTQSGRVLEVHNIEVLNVNNHRKGLSEYMMAEILKRHPRLRELRTTLAMDNKSIAQKALSSGLNCTEAIKSTPAYKMRAKLGFTQIANAICGGATGHDWSFSALKP